MQISLELNVILLLTIGFTMTQQYLLGLPMELHENDINIWDEIAYEEDPFILSQQTLSSLCEEYEFSIDGKKFDCTNIKLISRLPEANDHILKKRENEEDAVEGSGAGDLKEEEEVKNKDESDKVTVLKISTEEPNGEQNKIDDDNLDSAFSVNVTTSESQAEEQGAPPSDVTERAQSIGNVLYKQGNDGGLEKVEETSSNSEDTQLENGEQKKTSNNLNLVTEKSAIDAQVEDEINTTPQDLKKKVRTLATPPASLSDLALEGENNEKESVDDRQAGNAILNNSEPKEHGGGLEGTDSEKTIQRMESNADTKSAQPNTGESSADVKKASKDTTILIFLFAAVVVVGVLAFGYKYMKKRKQRNAENSVTADNTNTIKRSLQNVTNNGKSDLEHGTEMKPLMKNEERKINNEYKDKEHNKVEEVNEKR